MSTPTRRGLLGGVAALATVPAASAEPHSDAALIRACHQFAEHELAAWYRYVVTPVDQEEQDTLPDWATLHWITATPATTPEGWRAKALACSAWDRDAYDNAPDRDGGQTPLLATLLRDMVAPARNAIMARLAVQHGPLPKGYTAEGLWLGGTAALASPSTASPQPHPDAELLAACAALDELERAYCATDFGCEPESPAELAADAERERLSDAQGPFVDRMCELRALTREGQAARARSLVFWKPCLIKDNQGGCTDDRLIYAVLRDLIG